MVTVVRGGPQQSLSILALPVHQLDPPPEGQRVAPIAALLEPNIQTIAQSVSLNAHGGAGIAMSQVRTLAIDNSANPQQLSVTHGVENITTIVPAGGGAIIPTTSTQSGYTFTLSVPNPPGAEVSVGVALYNYAIPPQIWGTLVVVEATSVPIGSIILWSGSVASIPAGFGLCDGTVYARSDGAGNLTSPNLVNRFVIGADNGATQPVGSTGGSFTIAKANLPNYALTVTDPGHTHTDSGHTHQAYFVLANPGAGAGPSPNAQAGSAGSFTTGLGVATILASITGITVNLGGGGTNYTQPYYALAYIIKI